MTIEAILGISFLVFAGIAYAFSRITTNRVKYVDQKVKDRGEREYVIVLYI